MPEAIATPTTTRLLEIIDGMAGQPVVMLVDLVADRFIIGSPKRISREAPVLILSYEQEIFTPEVAATRSPTSPVWEASPCPWVLWDRTEAVVGFSRPSRTSVSTPVASSSATDFEPRLKPAS